MGEYDSNDSDDDGFESTTQDKCNWVQCDRCDKWRRLPNGAEFEADALPELWFCDLNPNKRRSSCDAPAER